MELNSILSELFKKQLRTYSLDDLKEYQDKIWKLTPANPFVGIPAIQSINEEIRSRESSFQYKVMLAVAVAGVLATVWQIVEKIFCK
jgi:hypothetical protein